MSPTHSQRMNIMSEVLWFRMLKMYFTPLFSRTNTWETYQKNTHAFYFCFFSLASGTGHCQWYSAELEGPLFWVSLQFSMHTKRNWLARLHTSSLLYCSHIKKLSLTENVFLHIKTSLQKPTFGLQLWFPTLPRFVLWRRTSSPWVFCNLNDLMGTIWIWVLPAHLWQICPQLW